MPIDATTLERWAYRLRDMATGIRHADECDECGGIDAQDAESVANEVDALYAEMREAAFKLAREEARGHTTGHKKLRKWIGDRTLASVAEQLRTTRGAVSMWFTQGSVPDTVSRMILAKIARIPLIAWLTDEEKARLAAVRSGSRKAAVRPR